VTIQDLDWDERNEAHIARHHVTSWEVDEAIFEDAPHARHGPGAGLYHVYAQTDPGRYLFIVVRDLGDGRARVITARDMTRADRGLYEREGKG